MTPESEFLQYADDTTLYRACKASQQYFVQIDAHFSTFLTSQFGVPQGSILGPILFNLCVAAMSQMTESKCLQYADDTALYQTCKASQRHACINSIEEYIHSLSRWSTDTNVIFNSAKTKVMNGVSEWKLLGLTLHKHFHLDKHISKLLKRLLLVTFYAEKVKMIYAITCTKITERIVDILQTR